MKESQPIAKQLDINFQSEEELLKEQGEIADKYHLAHPDKLIKKDGEWYIDGMNVKHFDELYSDNDNVEQFKIIKSNAGEIYHKNEEVRKFLNEKRGPVPDDPTL